VNNILEQLTEEEKNCTDFQQYSEPTHTTESLFKALWTVFDE
jgi:hypothetical protein